jgi:DNA-binding transcriptional LysR family regulator
MNYRKYDYVIAVAETRSISQAARKMYLSQPALTRILNNIESELGVKLFKRNVIPIQLTYAGELYIEKARKILAMEKSLSAEMMECAEVKRARLSVGTGSSGSALWLPHILPAFHSEFPLVDINITNKSHLNLIDLLLKESIDIILSSSMFMREAVDTEHLTSARVILYVPFDHPVLDGIEFDYAENCLENPLILTPERLNGQDFVSHGPEFELHRMMCRIFDRHDITPGNILYIQNTAGAFRLAASGMGLTFATPYATHYTFRGMVPVVCVLEEDVTREVESFVIYKKGHKLSSIERRFIEISKEKLKNHPLLQPLSSSEWKRLKEMPPLN